MQISGLVTSEGMLRNGVEIIRDREDKREKLAALEQDRNKLVASQ